MIKLVRWALLLCCMGLMAFDAHAVTPMVAAGESHSIGLSADGKVYAWGNDVSGQLGLGRTLMATVPQAVTGLNLGQGSGQSRMASGDAHNVTVKADGSVWTWGANWNGQLGDGTTADRSSPVQVPGLTGVVAVAAGARHTLALKSDGSVWAWGQNSFGQLGIGTTADRSSPAQVPGITGVVAVAAGGEGADGGHSMAVTSSGSVWAWGQNSFGQLGDGTTTDRSSPVQVPGLTGAVAVAAGLGHSLALMSGGSVWAWGANELGQLGDGSTTSRSSPAPVPGLTGAVAVAAGLGHSLALMSGGSVWAWGGNLWGQLGDGTTINRSSPVQVPGITGAVRVAAGAGHSLARESDGSVWAWGANWDGQLGDGTGSDRSSPARVPGLTGVVAVAGGGAHTLALKSDGSLWAWGANWNGQLGDGTTSDRSSPAQVPGLGAVIEVAAGAGHTLALESDGSLWSWGANWNGQLGDGTTIPRSSPAQVPGITGVAAAAASAHTLARKSDGSLWAWGRNISGQLGDGTTTERHSPVPVPGLTGVVAVAAGGAGARGGHSLAVTSDGNVWVWGENSSGQLGDGTTRNRSSPGQVPGLTGVVAVAAGLGHSLALKSDGGVWAWGANELGQLGDGTTTDRSSPVQVPGLTGVVAVAAGAYSSHGVKSDGSIWAWGANDLGQLGDGTTTERHSPVQVPGFAGVLAVAGGPGSCCGMHTLALRSDGSVAAWGDNGSAQLGDGTLAQRLSPVLVVNQSVDGFLNLKTGTPIQPPPGLNVPFFVSSAGAITATRASVSTKITFNPADVGKSGAVFVTARVPAGSVKTLLSGARMDQAAAVERAATLDNSFVLLQLTATGWQQVLGGQLIPFTTGVLNELLASQTILNGTDTTDLKGAEYCVGYGTSATEMLATGKLRVVATIPTGGAKPPAVGCELVETTGTSTLSVTKSGSGSGAVTSSPAGIDCGGTCSAIFTNGASVTLTATADAGSSFAGWSNPCIGTGTCTLTMDTAKSVAATFTVSTFNSQSDCLFNWAEIAYATFLAPAGATSSTSVPYYYRSYPQTDAWLATSSADNHVYYNGPATNYSLFDLGAMSYWLPTAGCQ